MPVPRYHELFNPTLNAIKGLGGSATIQEINEAAIALLNLTPEEITDPHNDRTTKIEYRLAWARSYLKGVGLLTNSDRGVWALTPEGHEVDEVDPTEVQRTVRSRFKPRAKTPDVGDPNGHNKTSTASAETVLDTQWREDLLTVLRGLKPIAFERLCQRLLRESGFVQVQVTGRSGDGGIDGVGIVKIGGLLGFPIIFQCKRYAGSVPAGVIRDFRGAMIGRAERGLVITTGGFTRDARQEATRDGAPPIDLLDGDELLDKLKELRLGVDVTMIEKVSVVPVWFETI